MKRAREGAEDGDAEFSVVVSQLDAFSTVYSEKFIPSSSLSFLPKTNIGMHFKIETPGRVM